jgi:hypothetical protein
MRYVLLGVLALAIAVASLYWTLHTRATIRASAAWPTANGVVVSSRVKPDSTKVRGGGYNRHYVADVRYAYEVGARRYESNTFAFGTSHAFPDSAAALAEVNAYPPGRAVRVYHDPDDPATSCLAPGVEPAGLDMMLGMSGAFALGGAFILALGVWSVRRSDEDEFSQFTTSRGDPR